ncbi:DUF4129 domain-containing protein [Actinomyces urogenitalis]|uniref:DUF4129 domain-containing protein n=1 Tax=Actinomyces urogenitalis TaxID=103621 RepID=UPI00242E8602|nr:DUF4129 domain-containing protein [Actinomyces urogenitalis]MCI7457458.1 DUF4129 domain-containing protein [Actinomyces urogenitalis]
MRPAASTTTWRGLVLCALALAVVLVAWASTDTAPLMTTTAPSTRPQPSAAPTVLLPSLQPIAPPEPPAGTGTSWWVQALVVMVVLVAGVFACLVAWRLVRFLLARLRGLQPVAVDTPAEGYGPDLALLSPSQASRQVEALRHGSPANAIVTAWMALERDVTQAGVGTRPHETSTELVLRVLAQRQVPAAAIEDLASLYREARFSSHEMTEAARKQARGDLAQVHAALGLSEGQGPQAGASSREVRL